VKLAFPPKGAWLCPADRVAGRDRQKGELRLRYSPLWPSLIELLEDEATRRFTPDAAAHNAELAKPNRRSELTAGKWQELLEVSGHTKPNADE